MDYSALAEQVRGLGAYKAGVVDLQDVRFDRAFRAMCETNACGNYGKCWMCPPDAGDIDALMNEAQSYQKALVYQTVGKLEDSYDFEGMMEAARLHNELSRALAKWFATLPFAKSCIWVRAAATCVGCAPNARMNPAGIRSLRCPLWRLTASTSQSLPPPAA